MSNAASGKRRKEPAALTHTARYKKVLLFRTRGLSPYLLANIPPSRRRALSQKYLSLTFDSPYIHRHSLFFNHATIAWFSFCKKDGRPMAAPT